MRMSTLHSTKDYYTENTDGLVSMTTIGSIKRDLQNIIQKFSLSNEQKPPETVIAPCGVSAYNEGKWQSDDSAPSGHTGKTYSMKEVSQHCDPSSCWIVLWDLVYDVTKFLIEHPAGEDIILENAGRDATVPFQDVGHSKDALTLLKKYCIGHLTESERIFKRKKSED